MRALILGITFAFGMLSQAVAQDHKLLIIDSYHKTFSWTESYTLGLNKVLDKSIHVSRFEMNAKKLPVSAHQRKADEAFAFYKKVKPDVVLLCDDIALNHMLPRLQHENIDVVFLGVNGDPQPLIERLNGPVRVTGVLERPHFYRSLSDVIQLYNQPIKNIKILFDDGPTAKINTAYLQSQANLFSKLNQTITRIERFTTFPDWKKAVLEDDYDVLFVGSYQTLRDGMGKNIDANQVITWTNQNTKHPVFAFWKVAVGEGMAAGGYVLDGEKHGIHAAVYIHKVFAGMPADHIPISVGHQGTGIYSKAEFAQLGLTPPREWVPIR